MPRADRSRSEYRGRSSPAPSDAVEDDRDSTSGLVNLDREDSFRTVLHLIREFHSMEKPAGVALNRCKTSLVPICGLQSESSPSSLAPVPFATVSPGGHEFGSVQIRGRLDCPRVSPCSRSSPSEVL